jgi:hypothetical protein
LEVRGLEERRLASRSPSSGVRSYGRHGGGALRNTVQAAAEKTSAFATMTGEAPMSNPYVIQRTAPSICTARKSEGREKKYEPTKTAVAVHPRTSTDE